MILIKAGQEILPPDIMSGTVWFLPDLFGDNGTFRFERAKYGVQSVQLTCIETNRYQIQGCPAMKLFSAWHYVRKEHVSARHWAILADHFLMCGVHFPACKAILIKSVYHMGFIFYPGYHAGRIIRHPTGYACWKVNAIVYRESSDAEVLTAIPPLSDVILLWFEKEREREQFTCRHNILLFYK